MSNDSRDDGEPAASAIREAMAAGLRGDDEYLERVEAEEHARQAQHQREIERCEGFVLIASELVDDAERSELPSEFPPVAQMLGEIAAYVEDRRALLEDGHRLTYATVETLASMWQAMRTAPGRLEETVADLMETAAEVGAVSDEPESGFLALMRTRFQGHLERALQKHGAEVLRQEIREQLAAWRRPPGAPRKEARTKSAHAWLQDRFGISVANLPRARASVRKKR